jgi:hypothetical protein
MVSAAKAANFNALIVQVRKRGDAYYNPHVEPKANDIAANYDLLSPTSLSRPMHRAWRSTHGFPSMTWLATRISICRQVTLPEHIPNG